MKCDLEEKNTNKEETFRILVIQSEMKGSECVPSRTSHSSGGFDCTPEHDELHTVNHSRTSASAYEGLHERLECVHSDCAVIFG